MNYIILSILDILIFFNIYRSWVFYIGLDGVYFLYSVFFLFFFVNSGEVWLILFWKDFFSYSISLECEYGIGFGKWVCYVLVWVNVIYII